MKVEESMMDAADKNQPKSVLRFFEIFMFKIGSIASND